MCLERPLATAATRVIKQREGGAGKEGSCDHPPAAGAVEEGRGRVWGVWLQGKGGGVWPMLPTESVCPAPNTCAAGGGSGMQAAAAAADPARRSRRSSRSREAMLTERHAAPPPPPHSTQ